MEVCGFETLAFSEVLPPVIGAPFSLGLKRANTVETNVLRGFSFRLSRRHEEESWP